MLSEIQNATGDVEQRFFTPRMPLCILQTNISDWDIPDDVHVRLSQVISDILRKPEEVCILTRSFHL